MSCRVGYLSLLISWPVGDSFFVGEFLSASILLVSYLLVSCLSVSCHAMNYTIAEDQAV